MPLSPDRFALCPACDADVAVQVADREERDAAERILANFARSGLPKAYRTGERTWCDVRPSVVDVAPLFETITRGAGVYLWGPAGSYKTSVAASLLAMKIADGSAGRYVFVPALFAELFAIYAAQDGRSASDVIDRYTSAPYLVMDDLGKEKPTQHAASVLMQILDARYTDPRGWLIVTSNYSLDELRVRLDAAGEEFADPIVRRLSELCVPVPMEVRR